MTEGKRVLGALALLFAGLLVGYFLAAAPGMDPHQDDEHGHEDEDAGQQSNDEHLARITQAAAAAAGIETAVAGPASIRETLALYGRVHLNAERVYNVAARFGGLVLATRAGIGERVKRGQTLAIVENNESLRAYEVRSPADGVILSRLVNPGDSADGTLFVVADLEDVWVDLAAFPQQRLRLEAGQEVRIVSTTGEHATEAKLDYLAPVGSATNQSVVARVVLPNPEGRWMPGLMVTGDVTIAVHDVPLAVRTGGLQVMDGKHVAFEKRGEEYEAHPLELGVRDHEHVQVLAGIEPGTEYVTTNSYLIKADLMKSGVAHDH